MQCGHKWVTMHAYIDLHSEKNWADSDEVWGTQWTMGQTRARTLQFSLWTQDHLSVRSELCSPSLMYLGKCISFFSCYPDQVPDKVI